MRDDSPRTAIRPSAAVEVTAVAGAAERDDAELGKGRLETLTDGVFAIAMTILVFGLHIQQFTGVVSASQLTQALLRQWPGLAALALSFVVLGQFWVSMHGLFRRICRVDHGMIWLNITYLLFISLVPFTADHLGRYGAIAPVAVVYGLNLLALSVLQLVMWIWATGRRRLIAPGLPPSAIRRGHRLGLLSASGYAAAVAVGPAMPGLSVAIFALMSLLSITKLDHRLVLLRRHEAADQDSPRLSGSMHTPERKHPGQPHRDSVAQTTRRSGML